MVINCSSCYGKLDELSEVMNISMLKSLKTIMGHEVGFI